MSGVQWDLCQSIEWLQECMKSEILSPYVLKQWHQPHSSQQQTTDIRGPRNVVAAFSAQQGFPESQGVLKRARCDQPSVDPASLTSPWLSIQTPPGRSMPDRTPLVDLSPNLGSQPFHFKHRRQGIAVNELNNHHITSKDAVSLDDTAKESSSVDYKGYSQLGARQHHQSGLSPSSGNHSALLSPATGSYRHGQHAFAASVREPRDYAQPVVGAAVRSRWTAENFAQGLQSQCQSGSMHPLYEEGTATSSGTVSVQHVRHQTFPEPPSPMAVWQSGMPAPPLPAARTAGQLLPHDFENNAHLWHRAKAAAPVRRQQQELLSKLDSVTCRDQDAMNKTQDGCSNAARWPWLAQDRRDACGRPIGDPDYDPTTLFIPDNALRSMSAFNRQYWNLKRQAMDLVLFVAHGSFYNLFDNDADIGMRVGLALSGPSKPNMWKCGCTKYALPRWCGKVLALGYSVGVVEEVKGTVGKAGNDILHRRLERIYTPGTAAELCNDENPSLSQQAERPILSLVEAADGWIGFALLTASTGQMQVGQVQDCIGRGQLHTLLVRSQPAEAVAACGGLSPATQSLLMRYQRTTVNDSSCSRESVPLLAVLPRNSFARAGFAPCKHTTLGQDTLCKGSGEWALQHCKQLLCKQQQHSPAGTTVGMSAMIEVMASLALQQPLAVQAAAVLLQHLSRCNAIHVLSCTELLQMDNLLSPASSSGSNNKPPRGPRYMALDYAAITTLELLEGSLGDEQGSVYAFLDRGAWRPSRRKLKQWLCRPLAHVAEIEERLQVVDLFKHRPGIRDNFQSGLAGLPDLPRLMTKAAAALDSLTARVDDTSGCDANQDPAPGWVVALQQSQVKAVYAVLSGLLQALEVVHSMHMALQSQCSPAARLPLIQQAMCRAEQLLPFLEQLLAVLDPDMSSPGLHRWMREMWLNTTTCPCKLVAVQPCFCSQSSCLMNSIQPAEHKSDDVNGTYKGSVRLRPGCCPEYDQCCEQVEACNKQSQQVMQQLCAHLAFVRATSAQVKKVHAIGEGGRITAPSASEPVMVQVGCTNIQRTGTNLTCILPPLAAIDSHTSHLQQRMDQLMSEVVQAAAATYRAAYPYMTSFIDALSTLDVLAGFAAATDPQHAPQGCSFCRPSFQEAGNPATHMLGFDSLWHPCLSDTASNVVPNNVQLGGRNIDTKCQPLSMLLTGPNMGGKSTLLRAVCIATIMAQIGCYVPATSAQLTPTDAIFTRMGAHDRIVSGESTFMVEMAETAACLAGATRASLLVLDELGRGTATHDGYALAYAVLKHIGSSIGARTLFATHYHDLCTEPDLAPQVSMVHMAHETSPAGRFIPLHVLRPGPSPEGSSGMAVAHMAGLPHSILSAAATAADGLAVRVRKRQHDNGSAQQQKQEESVYKKQAHQHLSKTQLSQYETSVLQHVIRRIHGIQAEKRFSRKHAPRDVRELVNVCHRATQDCDMLFIQ